jgi:hypothetical protein
LVFGGRVHSPHERPCWSRSSCWNFSAADARANAVRGGATLGAAAEEAVAEGLAHSRRVPGFLSGGVSCGRLCRRERHRVGLDASFRITCGGTPAKARDSPQRRGERRENLRLTTERTEEAQRTQRRLKARRILRRLWQLRVKRRRRRREELQIYRTDPFVMTASQRLLSTAGAPRCPRESAYLLVVARAVRAGGGLLFEYPKCSNNLNRVSLRAVRADRPEARRGWFRRCEISQRRDPRDDG